MDKQIEKVLEFEKMEDAGCIFGNFDENLKLIENSMDVKVLFRDQQLKIIGNEYNVNKTEQIFKRLIMENAKGEFINKQKVNYFIQLSNEMDIDKIEDFSGDLICLTEKGKPIKAKTQGQKIYINAIKRNTIVFGIGPAGTGKTFLAVAMAVNAFKNKEVNRIVLTRPAVEAGEKLGFLPGDLQEKIDPYLRPLYDALFLLMGAEAYQRYLEKGLIEIAPLAYMRGRTLDDAFIILDEAQNTTPEQMKMFLTRIGFGSKVVVTGDVTQIDLPGDKRSGLKVVQKIIKNIEGIEFIYLTDKDVVRHELVQKIIKAYQIFETNQDDMIK